MPRKLLTSPSLTTSIFCASSERTELHEEDEVADEDVVDVDAHNDISMDVDAWVRFEGLKPYAYNSLSDKS